MFTKGLIKHSEYHDSVTLMQVARELKQLAGVSDAAVVMATAANKALLSSAGLLTPEVEAAVADDLAIVVAAESEETAGQALQAAEKVLARRPAAGSGAGLRPRTLRGAVRSTPSANLAIVSVAGQYAAAEAWEALRQGLHVLLFSDNVSLEDEIALKRYAVEHGLLLMGPGCGTALLDGAALGFANVVPRGPVGIVAAAGTGLQEVSTLLAHLGCGVSQGIGTGGRDLKEAVGGLMMREGIRRLQSDPATEVLLLVSKPPAATVAAQVLQEAQQGDKPAVVCFLGGNPEPIAAAGAIPAITLQEAAYLAALEAQGQESAAVDEVLEREAVDLREQAAALRARLRPRQRYLRGLYSGGTLAAEALVVWKEMGLEVLSNVAVDARLRLADATRSERNCAVDLGEEEFTVGRPHPMIDFDLRVRRLLQEAADPEVAVIVLDVVLGYGAHPDPAAELGPAVCRAPEGGPLFVASVTGTEEDPQGYGRQVRALEEAGVVVASCNAAAARLAGEVARGGR